MITLKTFVFNPFQENTYVISDETGQCVIIDAGCNSEAEQKLLLQYIEKQNITPVLLINTHGHIDHVLGIAELSQKFKLSPFFHQDEIPLLNKVEEQGQMFGTILKPLPTITNFLNEETEVVFGNSALKVFHVPGHSQGSVAFYSKADKMLITGDVLFKGSIGRTDLPGGDYDVIMNSIFKKLLVLDDDTIIFPGHGPSSAIGIEKRSNPFLIG